MKLHHFLIRIFFVILLLMGCDNQQKGTGNAPSSLNQLENPPPPIPSENMSKPKICLAFGYGGIGDMSFNDMQYNGLIQASRRYDIDIAYKFPTKAEVASVSEIIELLGKEKCDCIFTSGYLSISATREVAPKFPDISFVLIDEPLTGIPNVTSVIFAQHEGSFTVGALAARMTATKKVAFLGGVDIDVVKAFQVGFEEGVRHIDPSVEVITQFVSSHPDFSGFVDPQKGHQLSMALYKGGVDIIYSVAGKTGNGIIQAAKDANRYVIGVDANQDHLAPGRVLTSMMKRMDTAVVDVVGAFLHGTLKGNTVMVYGYHNKGISITDMKFTRDVIPEAVQHELIEIEEKLTRGDLKVTNVLK